MRRQMRAEVRAQFQAFRATGLTLDHVTAHKHFHLHPSILAVIIGLAREFGAPGVRAPIELPSVLARVEASGPRLSAWAHAALARVQRSRLRRAGFATTPDQVFDLSWSGVMTHARLAGLVAHLPEGVTEIYTYPATRSDFEGRAPGSRYEEELAALTSLDLRRQIAAGGIESGGFADAARRCRTTPDIV